MACVVVAVGLPTRVAVEGHEELAPGIEAGQAGGDDADEKA